MEEVQAGGDDEILVPNNQELVDEEGDNDTSKGISTIGATDSKGGLTEDWKESTPGAVEGKGGVGEEEKGAAVDMAFSTSCKKNPRHFRNNRCRISSKLPNCCELVNKLESKAV